VDHASCHSWDGDTLILSVRVQPRASRDEIGEVQAGRLKVRITAPPVDGKANTHLIRFLAEEFGVSRARVELISGETGREKRLRIHSPARIPPALAAADRNQQLENQ
jgi:uncharacterized protein (TIGR00251 family)